MQPAIIIGFVWLLFGGSHLVMSSSGIRPMLVNRFGERGFTIAYVAATVLTMAPLIVTTALYADTGAAGPNLASHQIARWFLGFFSALGAVLLIAALVDFQNSAIAQLAQRRRRTRENRNVKLGPPTAIERISRHPFFVGLAMLTLSHAMMADTLAEAGYFGGFALLSLAGLYFQDRKLRGQWDQIYADFEAETELLSLGKTASPAVLKSKVWLIAIVTVIVLFGAGHPLWTYANGAPLAAVILLFGLLATMRAMRQRDR